MTAVWGVSSVVRTWQDARGIGTARSDSDSRSSRRSRFASSSPIPRRSGIGGGETPAEIGVTPLVISLGLTYRGCSADGAPKFQTDGSMLISFISTLRCWWPAYPRDASEGASETSVDEYEYSEAEREWRL